MRVSTLEPLHVGEECSQRNSVSRTAKSYQAVQVFGRNLRASW